MIDHISTVINTRQRVIKLRIPSPHSNGCSSAQSTLRLSCEP